MNGTRFSRQNGGSEYHFSAEGKAETLCGPDRVELLEEEVSDRTQADRDWQTCPVCKELLRSKSV